MTTALLIVVGLLLWPRDGEQTTCGFSGSGSIETSIARRRPAAISVRGSCGLRRAMVSTSTRLSGGSARATRRADRSIRLLMPVPPNLKCSAATSEIARIGAFRTRFTRAFADTKDHLSRRPNRAKQFCSSSRSAPQSAHVSRSRRTSRPSHYLSEIVIRLRFAANSRPAFGPFRSITTPFSFLRLTPPAPPTNAPPAPTAL